MRCPICGKELPDNARKCDKCGCRPRSVRFRRSRPAAPLLYITAALALALCLGLLLRPAPAPAPGPTEDPALASGPTGAPPTRPPETAPVLTTPPCTAPPVTEPPWTEPPVTEPTGPAVALRTSCSTADTDVYYTYGTDGGERDLLTAVYAHDAGNLTSTFFQYDDARRMTRFDFSQMPPPGSTQAPCSWLGTVLYEDNTVTVTLMPWDGSTDDIRSYIFNYDPGSGLLTDVAVSEGDLLTPLLRCDFEPGAAGCLPLLRDLSDPAHGTQATYGYSGLMEDELSEISTLDGQGGLQQLRYQRRLETADLRLSNGTVTTAYTFLSARLSDSCLQQYQLQLFLLKLLDMDPGPFLPLEKYA